MELTISPSVLFLLEYILSQAQLLVQVFAPDLLLPHSAMPENQITSILYSLNISQCINRVVHKRKKNDSTSLNVSLACAAYASL